MHLKYAAHLVLGLEAVPSAHRLVLQCGLVRHAHGPLGPRNRLDAALKPLRKLQNPSKTHEESTENAGIHLNSSKLRPDSGLSEALVRGHGRHGRHRHLPRVLGSEGAPGPRLLADHEGPGHTQHAGQPESHGPEPTAEWLGAAEVVALGGVPDRHALLLFRHG